MAFSKGELVEVMSKADGYVGSYFSAKIIMELDDGSYVVKYKNLLKNDESGPLVEVVQADEVREVPVEIPRNCFSVNEYVDAFDNDGWWVGRVVGRVEGSGYYSVYFDTTCDLVDYPPHRLRVHLELSDDAWWFVRPYSYSIPSPFLVPDSPCHRPAMAA